MKMQKFSAVVMLLISSPLLTLAEPAAPPVGAKTAQAAALPPAKAPEAGLKMAMPTTDVLQIMGRPLVVNPMKSQTGKAEIWVYEREVSNRVEQLPISTPIMVTVTGAEGKTHQESVGEHTEYREVHHVTIAVVEVLMYNDHYVTHKVTTRESQRLVQ